jgi:hypothetical protein
MAILTADPLTVGELKEILAGASDRDEVLIITRRNGQAHRWENLYKEDIAVRSGMCDVAITINRILFHGKDTQDSDT